MNNLDRQKIDNNFNNLVKWNKNIGIDNISELEYEKMVRWASRTDPNTNFNIKKTDYNYYVIITIIFIIVILLILVFYYNLKPETKIINEMNDDKNKNDALDVLESDNEVLED